MTQLKRRHENPAGREGCPQKENAEQKTKESKF
jgi:hypothetical protein